MKKIIYSNYTKAVAAILFVISIVSGALIVSNGFVKCYDEKGYVYGFEGSFYKTKYFSQLISDPEYVFLNTYRSFFRADDENNLSLTADKETIEQAIEQNLNALYDADKIDYYIKWNDKVFTNCGASDGKELTSSEFYNYTHRDGNGNIQRDTKPAGRYNVYLETIYSYDKTGTITISTKVKDEYVRECRVVWERQAAVINNTFTAALIFVVFAILFFVYLVCVCGKNKDGQQKTIWIDNIWTEVHLTAIGIFGIGAAGLCVLLLDEYYSGYYFPYNLVYMIVGMAAALTSAVVITSLLSIIRNIKCKRFIEKSIILRTARWCLGAFIKTVKWIFRKCKAYKKVICEMFSKKSGVILIGMLFVYTAVIGFFGIAVLC